MGSLTKEGAMGQTVVEEMRLYFVFFLPPSLVHILPHMQGSLP